MNDAPFLAGHSTYVRECRERGYLPKFDKFAGHPNYYKLLVDFRVYDKNGNYAPQGAVRMSFPSDFSEIVGESLTEAQATQTRLDSDMKGLLDEIRSELKLEKVQHSRRDHDSDYFDTDNEDIQQSRRVVVPTVADRLLLSEWKEFKRLVGLYKNGDVFEKSADGDIIISIGNKLIYTDGKYANPGISKIVEFTSDYEDEIVLARRRIYNAEKGKSEIEDAYRVIENLYGQGFVNEYATSDVGEIKRYDRRTKRGKSKSDAYHREFMQNRIRDARKIAGFADDVKHSRREQSVYDEIGETDRVASENQRLKEDIEMLHRVISKEEVGIRRFRSLADYLKKLAGSQYNRETLGDELKELYEFVQTTDNIQC